jgi:DNA primase
MAFSPQFLDELRIRVGLADVVARRVRLAKKGREHSGLCPFHKEKTPSFTVNEEKGFYHCFGCGAHGSAIDFVMNTEGLSFPEAVERLAGEVGLQVPVDTPEERDRARLRQSLYDVMIAAEAWFARTLRMPEGRGALAYLKDRGINDDNIERFGLGFAPASRGALKAALARQGIEDSQMIEAGLLVNPDDSSRDPYDRFRDRVVFPINDRRGRVIAFGGRILGDGEPKYLNSPETPLFHKGRVLYGLDKSQAAARESGRLIVTEGYMDVIALHQAGFADAVAPLGTALTEEHLAELWRVVREPVLCFDGDSAGARAAARAAERALPVIKAGYSLAFATMPHGEDPDSLIATGGSSAMRRVLDAAVPFSEVLWRIETGGRTLSRPEEKAALQQRLDDHARRITDETVRAHFRAAFKQRLWPKRSGARRSRDDWQPSIDLDASVGPATRIDLVRRREEILLATLINHPGLWEVDGERLGTMAFSAPGLDKLRQEVLKTLAEDADLDSGAIENHLRECGLSVALDSVLSPAVYIHAAFARPDSSFENARRVWEETLDSFRKDALQAEILDAVNGVRGDVSDDELRRAEELARQRVQALEETDPAA